MTRTRGRTNRVERAFHDEGRKDRVVVDDDGAAAAEALDQRDARRLQRRDVNETLRLPAARNFCHSTLEDKLMSSADIIGREFSATWPDVQAVEASRSERRSCSRGTVCLHPPEALTRAYADRHSESQVAGRVLVARTQRCP